MLGLIIGAASGVGSFLMLSRFTKAVTGGAFSAKNILFGVAQFFLPLVVLLVCALLFPNGLLWAAAGMAGALIIGALTRFMITLKR